MFPGFYNVGEAKLLFVGYVFASFPMTLSLSWLIAYSTEFLMVWVLVKLMVIVAASTTSTTPRRSRNSVAV